MDTDTELVQDILVEEKPKHGFDPNAIKAKLQALTRQQTFFHDVVIKVRTNIPTLGRKPATPK